MNITSGLMIISLLYMGAIIALLVLGVYTLMLAIKALKIYIKNNS